jgi:NADPH:quinone reductase-like Zn-dependent oxidoreductase
MTTIHATTTDVAPQPLTGPADPDRFTSSPERPVAIVPDTMRALTYDTFGSPDVLELRQIAVPTPGPGQVLVRIRAAAANPWDWHFLRGLPYIARVNGAGLRKPKHPVLGGDVAGEIVATGVGAGRFAVDDAVYGFIEFGGFAEFVAVPETALAAMPRNLSFEEAAAVPLAATTALQGLRDVGQVKAGDRVLIIGASGGVGTFAVQIAKAFGAHVTGVASGRNIALLRALGADRVVDYTREDVTAGDDRYDVVFQLAGTASGSALSRILARGGRVVMSSGDSANRWIGPMGRVLRAVIAGKRTGRSILLLTARWNAADLATVAGLIETGDVRPVIDTIHALETTAEAVRYVESGRPRGKVVISVQSA